MSHHPERTEKNCLNCGTIVAGRFCQNCGQENVPSHMPFFGLVQHFIFDIFHFDGKFFDTLRYLFFKPGFVAQQYVRGKRMHYLDPIRMYLFTSAVFFLFFFAFAKPGDLAEMMGQNELSKTERYDYAAKYLARHQTLGDSSAVQPVKILMDTSYTVITDLEKGKELPDSVYPVKWQQDGKLFAAKKDSVSFNLETATSSKRLNRTLETRWKRYKEHFNGDTDAMFNDFLDKLLHRFPYLLFLSLPFFAATLMLLYMRHKQFFYFDHAVFTLYHYVFSFMLLLLLFGVKKLEGNLGWGVFGVVNNLLVISWPVHLFFAMKRFYVQSWRKTLAKFVLLNLLAFFVMVLLAIGFILYSVFTI